MYLNIPMIVIFGISVINIICVLYLFVPVVKTSFSSIEIFQDAWNISINRSQVWAICILHVALIDT